MAIMSAESTRAQAPWDNAVRYVTGASLDLVGGNRGSRTILSMSAERSNDIEDVRRVDGEYERQAFCTRLECAYRLRVNAECAVENRLAKEFDVPTTVLHMQ